MKLHTLQNNPGATRRKKRLGSGPGTGRGKTSARGQKGQKSRAGSSIRPGFGGGQIPLYRTLPHRGFNNANFRTAYAPVNVAELEKLEATEITPEVMKKAGILRHKAKLVKVLGHGEITRAVTVTADKFSASARQKIEAAGGKVILSAPAEEAAPAAEPAKEE